MLYEEVRPNFRIGKKKVGEEFIIIAGPCAIESYEQLFESVKWVKKFGCDAFRAGAFKPRTSPYSFQGLGIEGLKIGRKVSEELKIPFVTEVLDVRDVDLVNEYADIIQIGARNMQNFPILKAVGRVDKPIILKRNPGANIEELLLAAEYILKEGNEKVILCERGIRTFESSTRYTLDISAVPVVKSKSKLPIIIDPSHAAGKKEYVIPLAKAAKAVGADGIIVEVHNNPQKALSDKEQQLDPKTFKKLIEELKKIK